MTDKSLEEYQSSAEYFTHNNHRIAFWSNGQTHKPSILLLHGFPSASWDWHRQWQVLTKDFHLLAFDFLGFGLSDKPQAKPYSLIEQADIAEALLLREKVQACHIIAHDYGVSIAQDLLHRYERTSLNCDLLSIQFLNGGLFAEAHRPITTQKLLASKYGPWIAKLMRQGSLKRGLSKVFSTQRPPTEEEIDILWRLLNHNEGRKVIPKLLSYIDERSEYRDEWVSKMQRTKVPLHFINGIHDPISGLHMVELFEQLVPHGQVTKLDVGHYPQLEAPEQVNQALLDHLYQHQSAKHVA